MTRNKTLIERSGVTLPDGLPVRGYEMHLGETAGADTVRPFARLAGRPDGAMSADGRVAGTYLHGFLGDPVQRARLIGGVAASVPHADEETDRVLDLLAAHLEAHLDMDGLLRLAAART